MRSTSDGSTDTTTYSAEVRALTVIPGRSGSGAVRDVADPEVRDGEALVDVIRVGIDGTDGDIARGEYGTAPQGSDLLVIGHEALGRVTRGAGAFRPGTLVVASVRRPDGCPNCARGESDMCLWGTYKERGIVGLNGYCAERYAERPEFLFAIAPELAGPAVLLEPLTISEKGWRHVSAAQRRMTVWEPRRAVVLGAGTVRIPPRSSRSWRSEPREEGLRRVVGPQPGYGHLARRAWAADRAAPPDRERRHGECVARDLRRSHRDTRRSADPLHRGSEHRRPAC